MTHGSVLRDWLPATTAASFFRRLNNAFKNSVWWSPSLVQLVANMVCGVTQRCGCVVRKTRTSNSSEFSPRSCPRNIAVRSEVLMVKSPTSTVSAEAGPATFHNTARGSLANNCRRLQLPAMSDSLKLRVLASGDLPDSATPLGIPGLRKIAPRILLLPGGRRQFQQCQAHGLD